jgi:hypothetical protein
MDENNTSPVPTTPSDAGKQKGGIGYILLWILGVPIPILILIALVRGCT